MADAIPGGTRVAAGSPLIATGFVAVAACCFGSVSVLTLVGTGAGASLPTLIMWRYAMAVPLLMIIAGGAAAFRVERRLLWRIILLGGGGQAIVTGFTLVSLRWIPAATEAFLFYTFPAWVAIFAAVRGTEPLTRDRVVALVLAMGGIAFMVGAPGAESLKPIGVVFVIAAAIVYALYIPLLDDLRHRTNGAITTAWLSVGSAVVFGVWAVAGGSFRLAQPPTVWFAAVTLAIVCTVVAFLMILRGLAVLGPVRTAITCTIEPFWTAVLAALVLAQPIQARTLVGGGLIAVAVFLLQRKSSTDAEDAAVPV